MRGLRFALGAAALLVTGLLIAGAGAPQQPARAAGRLLYHTYCASCHGAEADGQGPVAAALRTPPPNLTLLAERWGRPLPRDAIAAFIDGRREIAAHGSRDMPVWGERFAEEEPTDAREPRPDARPGIGALLDYLESIQRLRDARESGRAPAARGSLRRPFAGPPEPPCSDPRRGKGARNR